MFQKPLARYVAAIIAIALLLLLCRNPLLQFLFSKQQTKALEKYGVLITVSDISFQGIDNVVLQNLCIQPKGADTLAQIRNISLNLSLLDLLTAKIGFNEIRMDTALLTVYNQTARNNISFLKNTRRDTTVANPTGEPDFKTTTEGYKSKLLRMFNTAFHVSDIRLFYQDSSSVEKLLLPRADYDLKTLTGTILNEQNKDVLQLKGIVTDKNKSYQFQVTHTGNTNVYLPFLNKERGLKCSFHSLSASLAFENSGDNLVLNTSVTADNFLVSHWRLATQDVVLPYASFNGKIKVSSNALELDSATSVTIKNVKSALFAAYTLKPEPVFTFHLHMPETVSDTFFHSLPQGMFNTLKGISCSGTLQYDLLFSIPTHQPDSLVFTSALKRKNFSIRHYGAENYSRINSSFAYEAFDKDRFMRMIQVGVENPAFTPLHRINSFLVKSVLQSEDPSFMQHRGFLTEAFRESIIKNYKEKRFARGGSTISMQLVKNVFLSRDKTVSRKAEEALIVYLIENLGLVSKERMLEVYLNVIEWGPNIYGIGEASRFYFNKTPAELSLQESIFLAGIIPMPKYFKYQFDKEGKMKNYLSGYFRILSGRMTYKGLISATDTIGLGPNVKLTGPALRMIVPVDSLPPLEN